MITDSVGQENQRARDALHNSRCTTCKPWEREVHPAKNASYGREYFSLYSALCLSLKLSLLVTFMCVFMQAGINYPALTSVDASFIKMIFFNIDSPAFYFLFEPLLVMSVNINDRYEIIY